MTQKVYPGTLKQALQDGSIKPGDRLLLKEGAYKDEYTCTLSGVTITAYPGAKPVINPVGYRCLFFGAQAHNVVWDGIDIDGSSVTAECIKITDGATNITIRNSELTGAPMQGVLQTGKSNCVIDGCKIHHIGTTKQDHGIYIGDGTATIKGNEIYSCSGHGVHLYGGHSRAIVCNNYIHDNTEVGIGCYSDYALVYNNIVKRCESNLRIRYAGLNVEAYFNTLREGIQWNVDIQSIWYEFAATLKNNLLDVDIFVDAAYRLTAGNNLVDATLTTDTPPVSAKSAGVEIPGITTDYAGTARANPPTIGAYE